MPTLIRWPACTAAHGWKRDEQAVTAEGHPVTALLGPETTTDRFTEAIPTWAANTPNESWIEIELCVRHEGNWSPFYQIARWDDRLENSTRTSFSSQRDEYARVAVDTLVASGPCDAVQARVLLRGPAQLHSFTIALSGEPTIEPDDRLPTVYDIAPEITIPLRSQMVYPNGGNAWCSPTCITMLLAYWHNRTGEARLAPYVAHEAVPDLAVRFCYDPAYDGTGNWIFNTAFAASLGLEAYVARFASLADLAPWLQAGVPIVASVSWKEGELAGAAIPTSNGHLLIITGLDGEHVITADPAGKHESEVRRIYRADELERAWTRNSQGTVYLIYPQNFMK